MIRELRKCDKCGSQVSRTEHKVVTKKGGKWRKYLVCECMKCGFLQLELWEEE
jgi:phage antirepressor YoqD-like protein